MPASFTPQRAGPSGLNAHLPPFRRRVYSFDEDEPERRMWPFRRLHLEFDYGDYELAENAEPEPLRTQKQARRRANLLIDAKAGVNGEASGHERSDYDIENLDRFIVADDVSY